MLRSLSSHTERSFIFDIRSFFEVLGRPAPSPEALTKLQGFFFAFLERADTPLCVMTMADLKSFLEIQPRHLRYNI